MKLQTINAKIYEIVLMYVFTLGGALCYACSTQHKEEGETSSWVGSSLSYATNTLIGASHTITSIIPSVILTSIGGNQHASLARGEKERDIVHSSQQQELLKGIEEAPDEGTRRGIIENYFRRRMREGGVVLTPNSEEISIQEFIAKVLGEKEDEEEAEALLLQPLPSTALESPPTGLLSPLPGVGWPFVSPSPSNAKIVPGK